MDAFLTDETSCALLRLARTTNDLCASECDARIVSVADGSSAQWWRLPLRAVSRYIEVDKNHPMCISVPDSQSRISSSLVRSTICSAVLPKQSYMSVELTHDAFLAIESPAHSFASMAGALQRAVLQERLNRLQARALLLAYGYELCGSYSRDAKNPSTANCTYRLDPIATPEELVAWCEAREGHNTLGIQLARSCAPLVLGGSASPAETIHGIVFTLRPQQGGLGMGVANVLMNKRLELSPVEEGLVHRLPLTPDITFPRLHDLVLEHQGGDHDNPLQYQEDASRTQDYAALGHPMMMTSAADFVSPTAYENFLWRFVAWVGHEMGSRAANRYQSILENPIYASARYQLIATLIDRIHDPWHW